jgi:protoporphyrinogen oxidase
VQTPAPTVRVPEPHRSDLLVTDTSSQAATEPAADPADTDHEVVIIGAGPAGLTAAYMLNKRGVLPTVLESDDVVGGISRTAERDGWRFDIGGHRFFTKVKSVNDLWFEILGPDEFLRRPRMSHIHYRGKLYDYPIKPLNALKNLGPVEAVLCGFSYLWAKVRPPKNQDTLEGYVVANYGWRLYNHFFKTYNEKVWGVSANEIAADWGAQRIKGMSLWAAVWEPIRAKVIGNRDKSKQVTSLIEEFNYPKYGPGQMWERCTEIVTENGTTVEFEAKVVKVEHADGKATAVVSERAGVRTRHECTDVISSMPISALLEAMDPPVPSEVLKAAESLRYRDFMTVALVVPEKYGFPDTWIYIHDPDVEVGRIQNFASWSPYLVKDGRTCLGLEFFVQEGDEMWTKSDEDLIEQGKREVEHLKLVDGSKVEAGFVVRMPKAYPFYDWEYKAHVETLRRWLETNTPNVYPVGRNGMHRYNNQDHSMVTAMLSVENIFGARHDVWSVNVEEEYHEEVTADSSDS